MFGEQVCISSAPSSWIFDTPGAAAELCLLLANSFFDSTGESRPWTAESTLESGSVMLTGKVVSELDRKQIKALEYLRGPFEVSD